MSPRYEIENWGEMQNQVYAKGIITAVDSENDTADVTVPGYQNGTDVPLFYHCSDDAEERSNGAIEGAVVAFSAGSEDDPLDGDEVIVMVEADTGTPIRIIGFVDGIKDCGFRFRILRENISGDPDVITNKDSGFVGEWIDWDDWEYVPNVVLFNANGDSVRIYYGDDDWWDEQFGWHPAPLSDDEPRPYLRYDENTNVWTCPIPGKHGDEDFRTPDGYRLRLNQVKDSIVCQFYPPKDWASDDPDYKYIWHYAENDNDYPYIGETAIDEEGNEYYLYLAKPGSYDFYIPLWRGELSWDHGEGCPDWEGTYPDGSHSYPSGGTQGDTYRDEVSVESTIPYYFHFYSTSRCVLSVFLDTHTGFSGCVPYTEWKEYTVYSVDVTCSGGFSGTFDERLYQSPGAGSAWILATWTGDPMGSSDSSYDEDCGMTSTTTNGCWRPESGEMYIGAIVDYR